MGAQFGGRGKMQPPNKGQAKCTKCGSEHWLRECPDRHDPRLKGGAAGTAGANANAATYVREHKFNLVAAMVAEQESEDSRCEAMFADKAIRQGKGVVDLGCADAMGASVRSTLLPAITWRSTGTPGSGR